MKIFQVMKVQRGMLAKEAVATANIPLLYIYEIRCHVEAQMSSS